MAKKRRRLTERVEPTQASVPVVSRENPYEAYEGRDWHFAPKPGEPVGTVSEFGLRALMVQWRRGRATRTLGQVLSDTYIAIFSALMIGAMAINVLLDSQTKSAACDTAACLHGRMLVPWGMYFALAMLVVAVARVFGPVLASGAEGFWLLLAPVRRAPFLRGRLWGALGIGWVSASILMAAIAGVAGEPPAVIVAWALAAGFTASGTVAWLAWEQSFERTRPARVVQTVLAAAAGCAVGLMVAIAGGWAGIFPPSWLGLAPWLFTGLGLALTTTMVVLARRRLEQFHSLRLTSGGSLVSGLQGAMFGLDMGLIRDILVDRQAIERGHVKPVRGRGLGVGALIWRDAQRLIRFPQPLVGFCAAILAPYACEAVGLSLMAPWLSALALMLAIIPMLGALRVLSRTRGLARTFPFSTGQIRTALFVVPGILALIWGLLAAPAFAGVVGGIGRGTGPAVMIAVACGAAGLLGAVRWQTAKGVDFGVPMMATSMGAMPPTLLLNLLRGFDIVTLITVPILLNLDPVWALGLALVVALFLRSGLNTDELQMQAKEQRELLATEKAKRGN